MIPPRGAGVGLKPNFGSAQVSVPIPCAVAEGVHRQRRDLFIFLPLAGQVIASFSPLLTSRDTGEFRLKLGLGPTTKASYTTVCEISGCDGADARVKLKSLYPAL